MTVRLAYTESGTGPPLLLVMGLSAPGAAWEPHVSAWSGRCRCLAVDNRGAGASPSPPGPWTTADMADDYAELLRELGTEPVPVVGISMGGAIAQELALRHPSLVSRLVLVATWGRCDPHTAEIFRVITDVWDRPETASALLQWLIWTPSWFSANHASLIAERAAPGRMALPALAAQAAACITHDALDRLGAIDVPTLVTAGAADRFVPLAVSRAVADAIPGAELEIFENAGHTHHWEELERFNGLVEKWLGE